MLVLLSSVCLVYRLLSEVRCGLQWQWIRCFTLCVRGAIGWADCFLSSHKHTATNFYVQRSHPSYRGASSSVFVKRLREQIRSHRITVFTARCQVKTVITCAKLKAVPGDQFECTSYVSLLFSDNKRANVIVASVSTLLVFSRPDYPFIRRNPAQTPDTVDRSNPDRGDSTCTATCEKTSLNFYPVDRRHEIRFS